MAEFRPPQSPPPPPLHEINSFEQLTKLEPSVLIRMQTEDPQRYHELYANFQTRVKNPRTLGGRADRISGVGGRR